MEPLADIPIDWSGLHLLIPLVSLVVCSISAFAIFWHDPRNPSNRAATALVSGAAWWSAMQLLWTHTQDAQMALWLHKLAAPGWAFTGPLTLQLMYEVSRQPPRWMRSSLRPLYGVAGVFALIQILTPWMHVEAVRVAWGWGFVTAPMQAVFAAFTLGCVIPAIAVGLSSVRGAPSPAEREQVRMLTVAIATPLILTSSTAVVLPMMGIQVPRLGPASFAILGAVLMWTYYRFGFSAFAPGTFSAELVEMLPVGVCLLDPNGRVLRANETMAKLAGVEVGTLSGAEIARLIEGIGRPNEILTDAECGLTPLAGQTTEIPVAVSTSAICDRRGLHLGSALVVRDLREMVRLRRHLVTSGRMAAVGELAAGIAHEINNPMAYVQANLSHLERLWRGLDPWLPVRGSNAELDALRDDVREMLDESLEGVERTSAIVRDVKSFAHAGTGEVESVELDSLLKDVLRVAEPQFRYSAKVRFEGGGVPAIKGRPQELKQVFLNLVMNAVQAVAASGGSVWVRTRLEDSHVVVEVEDDGSGIRREDFDRIFDPFFTTKPVGEGTGLGLAISHEIVLGHGAEIFVDSVQDRWTKFTVRFDCDPAAEDST